MNIVIIGGASYDHIIHVQELPKDKPGAYFANEHYYSIGGSGIGKALNMNKLEIPFTFLTSFGKDEAGIKIEETLEKEGIDYRVDYDLGGSTTHTNLMDSNGDRVSIFTSIGNPEQIIDVSRHKDIILNADLIVLNISFFCRQYIPLVKESMAEVWTDVHDFDGKEDYHKDFIDAADVVFMSSDKAKDSYQDIANRLLETKKFIVCTHGKDGSEYFSKTAYYKKGVIPFRQVDTNGAGDAYFSGFLYGYINNESVEECMRYAMKVSGMSIESRKLYSESLEISKL